MEVFYVLFDIVEVIWVIITVDEGGVLCIILYCRSDVDDNDRGRGGNCMYYFSTVIIIHITSTI
jgi:hypothetical protein